MFSTLYKFVLAATVVAGVAASPLPSSRGLAARGFMSFDNYDGLSSFSGFDNFYGVDNFVGAISSQTVVEESSELVCRSESIEIIQQRLLVLQEMAKRIITEQICEVETQVVTFEQFYSSIGLFSNDLLRKSHLQVGFDSEIASHFSDIVSSDGSLSSNDFGFSGLDLGKHTVVVGGSNWNDASSPSSVSSAYDAAISAIGSGSSGLSQASVTPPPTSSSSSSSSDDSSSSDSGSSDSSSTDSSNSDTATSTTGSFSTGSSTTSSALSVVTGDFEGRR